MSALGDFVRRVDGLFVGLLTESEQRDFNEAIKRGLAMRSYEGAGGVMGLAKVRYVPDSDK